MNGIGRCLVQCTGKVLKKWNLDKCCDPANQVWESSVKLENLGFAIRNMEGCAYVQPKEIYDNAKLVGHELPGDHICQASLRSAVRMTEHDEMEPSENGAIEENLTSDDNYTIVLRKH